MDRIPNYIIDASWNGRAVLIAGQDLVRGDTQALLGFGVPPSSLRAAFSHPSPSLIESLQNIRSSAPSTVHVEIAQVPWSLIFTSAVETRLASALEAAAPAARRVRRRFVNDVDADNLVRSPTILEVMHLALVSEATSLDGAAPEPRQWLRVTRLMQPRILEHLKRLVGPAHIVIIDGVTNYDTLDRDDLIAALDGLDDAQIVLCSTKSEDNSWLLSVRPGVVVLDGNLAELLQQTRAETVLPDPELLEAEDFAITVRAEDSGERRTLIFRADEVRDIRRHLKILGDSPSQKAPTVRDERRRAFRAFLRTPRFRPDYDSFVSEFCLERQAYTQLHDLVVRRVAHIRGARRSSAQSKGPIILTGFPGSGRTTGLHWLGVRLRQEGWPVVHLAETTDEPDLFAIEQIIRLTELRLQESGAVAIVVMLADGVGHEGAKRLDDRLRRAGRRAIVVASGIPYPGHYESDEEAHRGTEISLAYQLKLEEIQRLDEILRKAGIEISAGFLRAQAGIEGFLGMLDRLGPDARDGLAEVLRRDFERFIPDLASALMPRQIGAVRGSFGEALARAFAQADLSMPTDFEIRSDSRQTPPSLQLIQRARDLVRTIFALAWLDRPAPLDLLGRRFPSLFASYDDVRVVARTHGFLAEIILDGDDAPALSAINPGIARVLRRHVVGYPRNVLDELRELSEVVSWPEGKGDLGFPMWSRFVFGLLRSISPRGPFRNEFGNAPDVYRLKELLQHLRESRGVRLPQLLMLEAITQREWVERAGLSLVEREAPLEESRRLLEDARDQVVRRPRTPARDHLLASILAAFAATLRRLMEVRIERGDLTAAQEIARPALSAAQRSQSLQENWHPFDAAALIYYRLAQAWQIKKSQRAEARLNYLDAVDRFGAILDLGSDLGDLPPDQQSRKDDRQREYLLVTGQFQLAREQAIEEANDGQLAGLCYLLRLDAIDPKSNRIRSTETAAAAFSTLASFPAAFEDERSLVLLQRLWIGAHLGNQALDSGPHVIVADQAEWESLQQITQRRIELGDSDLDARVGFWRVLSLLHLGNLSEARRTLQNMQVSIGRTRRRHFDPLILLSATSGEPRLFRALVRKREERNSMLVYVRDLDLEMQLSRRHLEPGEALNLRQGDIVEVHVALNYRGPVAVGPRWVTRLFRANMG